MINYHRHSHYSNIILPDSVATNEDYCKRAVELGHAVLSSCEHGTPGNYRQCAQLAAKYGLKWRYVAEAYFVKDRKEKDKTNCHLILAAKTEKGIGDINEILSEANITGYYYRPRIDLELLLSLDPADVFVTTACVGGIWNYGISYEETGEEEEVTVDVGDARSGPMPTKKQVPIKKMVFDPDEPDRLVNIIHQHFGKSFMLEIQYHHTDKQKMINRHILDLYRKKKIPMIVGLDSHYIGENDGKLRDQLLESRHLFYEDEEGWFMDYPDDKTVRKRFREQGIFSDLQIKKAMDNTDIFLTFEDVTFDTSKKLPTIYPELTQEERNQKYRDLIQRLWDEYKKDIPQDRWPVYEEGIAYEVDTITSTNTSDYFLIDYEIIKRFKELGGHLTYTGRGSAPSYFTNTLLGFSSIDRFALPITMYPDRFISAERLKAGSLPDIDMNVGNPEVFAQAQAEVMGEWHSAPMVAFGTLKRLSAWKMYCRASNVPFEIANKISDSLKKYELDMKHAEEDDDEINPFDYVPAEYHEQLRMSEKYLGMVDSISPHPCAYVVFNGDIRREFGIFRLSSKTGKKKEIYAAFVDGATADGSGYLKNDDLKVDVVEVNSDIYRRIGIKQPSVPELLRMTDGDKETWAMYAKGYTMGLNQAEKEKSTQKVMTYKPRNISELSAFVAGIRPAFQSMLSKLLNREHFDYGIPALDKLLQTKELPQSFILYQEQMMKVLQYAGFTAPESYASIKAIAKKHPEKVLPLKARFLEGFSKKLIEEENVPQDMAGATSDQVWTIISDACGYGFNSSHATSVALDSLYTAWAKAHHPYETYVALLSNYAEKGDKERIDKCKQEMKKAFGITIAPCKFRQDNRSYFVDKDAQTIADSLTSIKGVGKKDAEALLTLADGFYPTFVDLLYDLTNFAGAVNSGVIETLIKMDYFDEFGSAGKLMKVYTEFKDGKNKYTKSLVAASVEKRLNLLRDFEMTAEEEELPMHEVISFEVDKFGTPFHTFKDAKDCYAVLEVDETYTPKVKLYSLTTGNIGVMKIKKAVYKPRKLVPGNIIFIGDWKKKQAYTFKDGKSQPKPGVTDLWCESYMIIPPSGKV